MNVSVALRLGRVSNLPTVWTNMLAGIILVGGAANDSRVWPLAGAMSLFYVGGMYLNDAFDADIDAFERPERPIPSGQVSRPTVFRLGFAMLALGIALLAWVGFGWPGGTGVWPPLCGLGLALTIIAYNRHHKANSLSPLLMGMCRVFVYVAAGACFAFPPPAGLLVGAALLLSYLIGLTYVAKQENLGQVKNLWPLIFLAAPVLYGATLLPHAVGLWPFWAAFSGWILVALWFVKRRQAGDIPRAVVSLIAGISLFDAMLIAVHTPPQMALIAVAGFALTLFLQKFISGT
jgi:4-hydroxybenzoate polyprenyltransferase